MTRPVLPVIGWREWLALPELSIPWLKAKIDTGARTSALHAFDVEVIDRGRRVRFSVHPIQRDSHTTVTTVADLIDQREVRSSAGHTTYRPVIETQIELMGRRLPIEVTLVNLDEMGFRMLIVRSAIKKLFTVDAGRSYISGRPEKKKKKRRKL